MGIQKDEHQREIGDMAHQRDVHGAMTLNAEYYTSAEIYRQETEQIFQRQWMCCGRAAEFDQPGRCRVREIEGESLILLRDSGGALRCFYNVCRHRGTRLCEGDAGIEKVIRCAYHGWTYDVTGRLVNAPNMGEVDGFELSAYPLNAVETAEWEGFVFANLSEKPRQFDTAYRQVLGKFRDWSVNELVCVERRIYEVDANWKLLFQNYSECYHCSRVHPQLNALSENTSAANDLFDGAFLGGPMELAGGVDSMTTTGESCGVVFASLNDVQRRRVYYYTLFPTMFLSPHPDYVLVHRIERIGVARTRVVCEFLFDSEAAARPEFDPAPAVEFWDETNRQDWHICELSQQGIASRSYKPGPYSNLECTVAEFDRHYLHLLNGE